jgi:hypothetical protein
MLSMWLTHKGDNMPVRTSTLIILALTTACATDRPEPTGLNAGLDVSFNRVSSTEALASPVWQATAANLVSQASFNPVSAAHAYPMLGVADYLAVQRAEAAIGNAGIDAGNSSGNGIGAGGRARLESDRGAVAGASVVVLSFLFPTQVQALEDMVTTQANAGPGQPQPTFAAGEAIGRAVGAEIVTRARADHFNDPNTAVPPVGPGFWTSSAVPPQPTAGGTLPGTTPWFLTRASQFRSGRPPAFRSDAFNVALAEIRQISDTRTTEQVAIATFWAQNPGTPTTPGFWLSVPADSGWIAQHGLSERETTHLYALLSATMFDSQIGCWDTKLTYWLIRPWAADPGITTLATVGKPNHPSYPSGHSCLSSSAAEVLSLFFPEKRAQLDAMVIQAGLSRMYAGIHYRFDIDAGRVLGRSVAQFTISQDASGNSVLTPH